MRVEHTDLLEFHKHAVQLNDFPAVDIEGSSLLEPGEIQCNETADNTAHCCLGFSCDHIVQSVYSHLRQHISPLLLNIKTYKSFLKVKARIYINKTNCLKIFWEIITADFEDYVKYKHILIRSISVH